MYRRGLLTLVLLSAAMVTVGFNIFPNLCHPQDEGCQTNPQHHAAPPCGCSCHMAAVIPTPFLALQNMAGYSAAVAAASKNAIVYLSQPTPPPRG